MNKEDVIGGTIHIIKNSIFGNPNLLNKTMNKKLRLLITGRCPNNCELCCNKQFDLNSLPIVDRFDYEEIMITGGEPLLFLNEVIELVQSIKYIESIQGKEFSKKYVYTADCSNNLLNIIPYVNGVVVTPHNKKAVEYFIDINRWLLKRKKNYIDKSLRLNLFPNIKEMLKDVDLSMWQVKDIEWVKDCPVPEGEDFRRIAKLW